MLQENTVKNHAKERISFFITPPYRVATSNLGTGFACSPRLHPLQRGHLVRSKSQSIVTHL